MNITSNRNLVLTGFLLSLISVAFNSVVISYVSKRLKEVDEEYYDLVDSLTRQSAELNEGDSQFDLYRVMHNVAFTVPATRAKQARQDAEALLRRFLTTYYAAANDIRQTEVTRAEVEEAGQIIPILEKALVLSQELQAASNPADRARLAGELEKLSRDVPEPQSELGKKLREIQKHAQAELAEDDVLMMSTLMPVMKSLRGQIVESIQKKEDRMRELQRQRATLVRRSGYSSYAAIVLQLFGLMLILAKDLLKERQNG